MTEPQSESPTQSEADAPQTGVAESPVRGDGAQPLPEPMFAASDSLSREADPELSAVKQEGEHAWLKGVPACLFHQHLFC